jgi:hypothetical protein
MRINHICATVAKFMSHTDLVRCDFKQQNIRHCISDSDCLPTMLIPHLRRTNPLPASTYTHDFRTHINMSGDQRNNFSLVRRADDKLLFFRHFRRFLRANGIKNCLAVRRLFFHKYVKIASTRPGKHKKYVLLPPYLSFSGVQCVLVPLIVEHPGEQERAERERSILLFAGLIYVLK